MLLSLGISINWGVSSTLQFQCASKNKCESGVGLYHRLFEFRHERSYLNFVLVFKNLLLFWSRLKWSWRHLAIYGPRNNIEQERQGINSKNINIEVSLVTNVLRTCLLQIPSDIPSLFRSLLKWLKRIKCYSPKWYSNERNERQLHETWLKFEEIKKPEKSKNERAKEMEYI